MTRAVVALLLLPLLVLLAMPVLAQSSGPGGGFSYPFRFGLTAPKSAPELTLCTSVSRCILFVFSFIFKILIWVAGAIAVIALVLAGLTYIGKPEEAQRVHAKIIWALVGIAVALASFALVRIIEVTLTRGFALVSPAYAQTCPDGYNDYGNGCYDRGGNYSPYQNATPPNENTNANTGVTTDPCLDNPDQAGCPGYSPVDSGQSSGDVNCDPNDPNCFDRNIITPDNQPDYSQSNNNSINETQSNGSNNIVAGQLSCSWWQVWCLVGNWWENRTSRNGNQSSGTGTSGAGAGAGGGAGSSGTGAGTTGSSGGNVATNNNAANNSGNSNSAGNSGSSANNPLNQFKAPSGLAGIPGCNPRGGLSVFNYLQGQQVPEGLLGTCTLGLLGLKILPFIYTIVLLLSVGYLIILGYQYVTSGGQVANLHQKLLWAIIGVIVAVIAFSAVKALEISLTTPDSSAPSNQGGQIIDGQRLPPPAPIQ